MFNLEDFKKYGVAIRRDGERVSFIAHIPGASREEEHVLSMDDNGNLQFNGEDGLYLAMAQCGKDLVDVDRPMRHISFFVPEPISEMPKPGDVVYAAYGNFLESDVFELVWGGQSSKKEQTLFKMGILYETVEDARAARAAIRNGFEQ